MINKIFYTLMVSILIIGCGWETIKDKRIEIVDLFKNKKSESKYKTNKNQDSILLNGNDAAFAIKLEKEKDLKENKDDTTTKNNQDSMFLDENNIYSKIKVEKEEVLKDKVKVSYTSNGIAQNFEKVLNHKNHKSKSDSESSFSLLESQERNNKKIVHRELKKLQSLLHTNYENKAFKEASSAKDKIDSSNIGKGIVDVENTYSRLYYLLWDMQTRFYSKKKSFLDGVKAEKNREKAGIIFRSISSINEKIRNANHILDEIKDKLQNAINNWNNANALLKESIEELALAIEKRYTNDDSKKDSQVWGFANYRDINQADDFAKRARDKAENSITNLENASNAIAESLSTLKGAEKLLQNIEQKFYHIGLYYR
ncbi:hypothetical protein [Borreliella americana]|uniref:hypothetical protein n=1 Tax=Borreliella americana TaxID=478807 RepID=UPI001E389167|nr:hypothetical protein [Borreliella americana]MCD2332629.1 hypothetical protein [Borreliella americana]